MLRVEKNGVCSVAPFALKRSFALDARIRLTQFEQ